MILFIGNQIEKSVLICVICGEIKNITNMNKNQETERGELTRFLDELQLLKRKITSAPFLPWYIRAKR